MASAALVSGMAKAGELTYDLILNQGSAPYANLQSSALCRPDAGEDNGDVDTNMADQ